MITRVSLSLHRAPIALPASDDWQLGELLAEDRWTQTCRATLADNAGGADFAAKLARHNLLTDHDRGLAQGLLQREALVSRRVRQRNLATTLDVIRRDGEIWLLQPSLTDAVAWDDGIQTLGMKLWTIRQAAQALMALHGDGWLHGNVSVDAIRLSASGHATLGELGWCRQLGSEECDLFQTAFMGQLAYAAPEMFDDAGQLTPAADVYSLGIVLFELLTGATPFAECDGPQLVAVKRLRAAPLVNDPHVPYAIRALLAHMLDRDPLRRPTAHEVVDALVAAEISAIACSPPSRSHRDS